MNIDGYILGFDEFFVGIRFGYGSDDIGRYYLCDIGLAFLEIQIYKYL